MASQTAAPSTPQGAGTPAGLKVAKGYRPHLDGIRAVAVYLVVAFHGGGAWATGGFVGVDVFFVLSGYLVTQLLMRDLEGRGSIDLWRFYSRRIRRLLPAAAAVLVASAVVFSAVGSPAELLDAQDAVRAAALYVANWHFIGQSSDYFGADIQASPVVHFWSLSVEEQFYATWPLLLGALHLLTRRAGARRWSIIRAVVAVAMVCSAGAALLLVQSNLTRAYYGTDTRAYQLLAGALVAMSPTLIARRRTASRRRRLGAAGLAALIALVVLASSVLEVNPVVRGALATVLTVTLIISIEAQRGIPRAVLSWAPIVYLGRISYGTYLWHWLVIVVAARVIGASPLSTTVIAVLLATGLAALSFELLERPIRESRPLDRRRIGVVAAGLALSGLIGLVVAPRVLEDGEGGLPLTVAQGTAVGVTRVPADLDWRGASADKADFPECTPAASEQCTLVKGSGRHILVIGDSHARMFLPMLTSLARDRSLTLSAAVAPVCPWQNGLIYLLRGAECLGHQADWYPTIVDRLDPDVVILVHRTFDDPLSTVRIADEAEGASEPGSAEYLDHIRTRSAETLASFRDAGRKVVIIEPVPVSRVEDDPLICLSGATYLDECRFVSHVGATPVEQIYRSLAAADDNVWTFNLDRQVCPYLPICDPIVGGLIVKRDDTHLTTSFASALQPVMERFLDDNGILN